MPTSKCPLLTKLPLEIRLNIYEYILEQDGPIQLTYLEASDKLIRTRPLPLGPLTCLQILLVCRQIHQESLPIFTSTNNLVVIAPILGQYLKLVQGHPLCVRNVLPALDVLRTWLRWSVGKPTQVGIHVGTFYTFWERATADVVSPAITMFLAAVRGSRARVTIAMSVNWSATPATHSGFEVELPLWDLSVARRTLEKCIETQREWVVTQKYHSRLMENIHTCHQKFDELFKILEDTNSRGGREPEPQMNRMNG